MFGGFFCNIYNNFFQVSLILTCPEPLYWHSFTLHVHILEVSSLISDLWPWLDYNLTSSQLDLTPDHDLNSSWFDSLHDLTKKKNPWPLLDLYILMTITDPRPWPYLTFLALNWSHLVIVHPYIGYPEGVFEEGVAAFGIPIWTALPKDVPHPGAGNYFQLAPTHPDLLKRWQSQDNGTKLFLL